MKAIPNFLINALMFIAMQLTIMASIFGIGAVLGDEPAAPWVAIIIVGYICISSVALFVAFNTEAR